MTLYRVDDNSRIIQALMKAADRKKQVAVLVELKARFDEENNIGWAKELERKGVHVAYGFPGRKTHAKMCLVVRAEKEGIRYYVHMSTGNYNAVTGKLYTDFGYLTSDSFIGKDISDLFNALTGYSRKDHYIKLLVAPQTLRHQILERIRREIDLHEKYGNGHLIFKMNSLVDYQCIRELYRASRVGVKVDLLIRGICCLRPGIYGLSENIRVTSIVGRFLEHSRVYYFRNGGKEEIFMGSADLMPRNLDNRVEILFPVSAEYIPIVRDVILGTQLKDNVKARLLLPNGKTERIYPQPEEEELDSQLWMLENTGSWDLSLRKAEKEKFSFFFFVYCLSLFSFLLHFSIFVITFPFIHIFHLSIPYLLLVSITCIFIFFLFPSIFPLLQLQMGRFFELTILFIEE